MRLRLDPVDIDPDIGFENANDIFGYQAFGERLANLVCNIDHATTILLDGPWGAGKSTFMRQWTGYLSRQGANVIYFDAFEHDFHESAFLVLVREIVALAEASDEVNAKDRSTFVSRASSLAKSLLPLTVKVGLKAATFGALSVADLEEGAEKFVESASEAVEDRLGSALEERIKSAEDDKQTMKFFKEALASIASSVSVERDEAENGEGAHRRNWPLVFVIDELDRCKPSFAIEVIEIIKHLFSVDGVQFVLATNVPHMAAVIRGRYGEAIDAETYLNKFYDLRVSLPEADRRQRQSKIGRYIDYLWHQLEMTSGDVHVDEVTRQGLSRICEHRELQFREVDRICSHLVLYLSSLSQNTFKALPIATILAVARLIDTDLYKRIRQGRAEIMEVHNFIRLDDWQDEADRTFYSRWIEFTMTEILEEEDSEWMRGFWNEAARYNFDRLELPGIVAERMEELNIKL